MLFWLEFLIGFALIILSGCRLSRYGDFVAEKNGVGRTGSAAVSHGTERRSIGRVGCQPRPKSISEAMMKVFHELTQKK